MINIKDKKDQSDFNNYKQVRNEITFQIRKAKNERIDRLKKNLEIPVVVEKIGGILKKFHKIRSSIFYTLPEKKRHSLM